MKKLIEKRDQIAAQMRELHAASEKEDKPFTSEQRESWEAMKTELADLDERIARSKEVEGLDENIEKVVNEIEGETRKVDTGENEETAEKYTRAFNAFLREGISSLNNEDRTLMEAAFRAQSQGTGSEGGFSVPEGFGGKIIETLEQFGGIMSAATLIQTEGAEDIPFPTVDDTGNSGVGELAENATMADQDVVFGQATLNAYIYGSGVIPVSHKLLGSQVLDLEGFLAQLMGKRIGRRLAGKLATGTGSSQPQGITIGAGTGVTAASATALAYTDITGLEAAVDPAYQAMGKFVFNQTTLKAFKDLADSDGRPLWLPGLADRAPATLLGYEYVLDNSMPTAATGTVPVVFGDISQFYVRQAGGMTVQRLVERYAEKLQVGFLGHAMYDGRVMDSSAIKKLTMA